MSACAAREAAEPEITPNRIDAPLDGRLLHRGSTRLLTNQTVARPEWSKGAYVLFVRLHSQLPGPLSHQTCHPGKLEPLEGKINSLVTAFPKS